MSALTDKVKDWAVIVALVMSGMTFKVSYDNHGLSVEIEKTQKQLAEAEAKASDFALAGVCDK